MKYIIGKRYMWSPYRSGAVPRGKEHLLQNGILTGIDSSGNGFLTSQQNENWVVPLDNLIEVKHPRWRK